MTRSAKTLCCIENNEKHRNCINSEYTYDSVGFAIKRAIDVVILSAQLADITMPRHSASDQLKDILFLTQSKVSFLFQRHEKPWNSRIIPINCLLHPCHQLLIRSLPWKAPTTHPKIRQYPPIQRVIHINWGSRDLGDPLSSRYVHR